MKRRHLREICLLAPALLSASSSNLKKFYFKGGEHYAELVDDIFGDRIDRGSSRLQRYSRSSDSDRLDLIRRFLGVICCQSDYGTQSSSVMTELRNNAKEKAEAFRKR